MDRPAVGTRVVFIASVDRFPHDWVDEGETGTVSISTPDLVAVTLDDFHNGFAEWDNAILFPEGDIEEFNTYTRPKETK